MKLSDGTNQAPVDFTLTSDRGETLVFDAAYRTRGTVLLSWYRGHW
ncbi:MAG: hypothetical protein AAF517_28530 [Planctomycetota bacterium]